MAIYESTGLRNLKGGINTNLITNGDFTTDTASWTASGGTLTSVANGQSGNCLQITPNSVSVSYATQSITTVENKRYLLSLYTKNVDASSLSFMIGTTATNGSIYSSRALTYSAGWQQYFCEFRATGATTFITLQNDDTTNTGKIVTFDTVVLVANGESYQDIFNPAILQIWSGARPASADSAPTGTRLWESDPFTFGDTVTGVISKSVTDGISGTVITTGLAGYARLITTGDTGTTNTIDPRITMTAGTTGTDITLSNTSLVANAPIAFNDFAITIVAS